MGTKEVDKETMGQMGQIVGPAMRLMNELTKDIKAENIMSEFVDTNIGDLLGGDNEMASGFLVKAMVDEANKDPKVMLAKCLKFYDEFRMFYTSLMESQRINEDVPEHTDEK